jgi:tripartite-type tricarboxylate transporter receptor subunit TctC
MREQPMGAPMWKATAAGLALALALCATTPASAQDDTFYAGKTVTLVVGFSPGGGYDIYARTVARFIGNHIPGKPTVIVQNMPGAGSFTSVRYLDGPALKDGTIITAFNPGVITDSLTEPEKFKIKFTEFAWLGSITRDIRVCYAWHTAPIKTWDDLAQGKEFIMGATGVNTSNYVNGAVLRNLFGLKVKQITGFPGSNEMRLATERGELYGDCGSWSSIPADWVKGKKIVPFVAFSPRTNPEIPKDLPFIGTFAKTEEQKQVLDIIIAAGELGRPYIMSRQVPAARVAIMRKAFEATMKDQAFLAEAAKQDLPVDPATATEAEDILKRIYSAPPQYVAKAKEVMK